jgi:hypothetical protein
MTRGSETALQTPDTREQSGNLHTSPPIHYHQS